MTEKVLYGGDGAAGDYNELHAGPPRFPEMPDRAAGWPPAPAETPARRAPSHMGPSSTGSATTTSSNSIRRPLRARDGGGLRASHAPPGRRSGRHDRPREDDRWTPSARPAPGAGSRAACCNGCPARNRGHLERSRGRPLRQPHPRCQTRRTLPPPSTRSVPTAWARPRLPPAARPARLRLRRRPRPQRSAARRRIRDN